METRKEEHGPAGVCMETDTQERVEEATVPEHAGPGLPLGFRALLKGSSVGSLRPVDLLTARKFLFISRLGLPATQTQRV